MTDDDVARRLSELGISRVTHFTSTRNLPKIFGAGQVLSTGTLLATGATFDATDAERFDGHLGHICCNLEYPNFYYFAKATRKQNAINYSDWAVLLLDPTVATQDGVLFAPGNAAKGSGADLRPSVAGLDSMYAPSVYGFARAVNHRSASPTDVQAEVLIPGPIEMSAVVGIVVPDASSLKREVGRLEQIGHDPHLLKWYISAGMFERDSIVRAVRGDRPIPTEGPCETRQQEAQ